MMVVVMVMVMAWAKNVHANNDDDGNDDDDDVECGNGNEYKTVLLLRRPVIKEQTIYLSIGSFTGSPFHTANLLAHVNKSVS